MKHTLTCRLTDQVITDEGDFIPKGTPVQVLGWEKDSDPDGIRKIMVCPKAYVFRDDRPSKGWANRGGCIGNDLIIRVMPCDLEYLESTQQDIDGAQHSGAR